MSVPKAQLMGYLEELKILAEKINHKPKFNNKKITIMEICGGHTNVILNYGIRDMIPKNINLISGPGCPVCVSSQFDIDCMIELANRGIPVATYGDMMRVPGSNLSLEQIKAKGADIFEVYSATEVLKLKEKYPEIVFFGVGFETTAPMTAYLLEKKVCVYSVHKLVPPAIEILINDPACNISGFINPGHVSAIIGVLGYEKNSSKKVKVPQVITGFTPERIVRGILVLLDLINQDKYIIINAYPEVVSEKGNVTAQKLLEKHFKIVDSEWRGLGMLPKSGLEVKDDNLNARIKYNKIITQVQKPKKTACRCGEVLKGQIEPSQCPLYKNKCTPESPIGACMVSAEGSCSIYYRYGI